MPTALDTWNHRFPPVMGNPDYLAPGEDWVHTCKTPVTTTSMVGEPVRVACNLRTQGGRAGLRAHQLVVHRTWTRQ